MIEKVARPQFPTRDGKMWKPQGLLWAQMCAVHGSAFVAVECQKMNIWLLDHPSQWKTCNGMPRFINSWLKRAKPITPQSRGNRPTDAWMLNDGPEIPPDEVERMRARRIQ